MADFINTIDALGDDVVIDSIIQRTITEFKDNVLTEVGARAFYSCTSLETVELPNVTSIKAGAFENCTSLTSISIPSAISLASVFIRNTVVKSVCIPCVKKITYSQAFRDATSLELLDAPILEEFAILDIWYRTDKLRALILRNTEKVCVLTNSDPAKGTNCYIYVPRTMADGSDGVEAYKTATNWSNRADMIRAIEDYPEITGG